MHSPPSVLVLPTTICSNFALFRTIIISFPSINRRSATHVIRTLHGCMAYFQYKSVKKCTQSHCGPVAFNLASNVQSTPVKRPELRSIAPSQRTTREKWECGRWSLGKPRGGPPYQWFRYFLGTKLGFSRHFPTLSVGRFAESSKRRVPNDDETPGHPPPARVYPTTAHALYP